MKQIINRLTKTNITLKFKEIGILVCSVIFGCAIYFSMTNTLKPQKQSIPILDSVVNYQLPSSFKKDEIYYIQSIQIFDSLCQYKFTDKIKYNHLYNMLLKNGKMVSVDFLDYVNPRMHQYYKDSFINSIKTGFNPANKKVIAYWKFISADLGTIKKKYPLLGATLKNVLHKNYDEFIGTELENEVRQADAILNNH